jgi:CRP-like cAMP-binding protein
MLHFVIFTIKTMDYSLLTESHLFKGLSASDIKKIFSEVPNQLKKFKSGNVISQSGEPVSSLVVIVEGIVKGEMVDFSGRVIKIEDIPAPGALAPAFMFGSINRYPVNVVAVSDGSLLLIGKADFLKLLMRNDTVLVNFLDMISNRSQFLSEKIKFLNFKTIRGKLAHYILQKAGKERVTVVLDKTQSDLADFFGVARPSVARALGDLEDEGFISARGKIITITDRKGLADLTID